MTWHHHPPDDEGAPDAGRCASHRKAVGGRAAQRAGKLQITPHTHEEQQQTQTESLSWELLRKKTACASAPQAHPEAVDGRVDDCPARRQHQLRVKVVHEGVGGVGVLRARMRMAAPEGGADPTDG